MTSAAPGVGAVTGRAVVTESASVPVQDRAFASSLLPADVAYRRLALLCAGGFEQRFPRPGSRHVEVLEQLRRRGWKVVPGSRAPVQTLLRPQVWGRGARDVPGWLPAVVLEVGETGARIGIEGVSDDEDGHWIPAEDVTWARKRLEGGKLGPKAKAAGDLVEVGDVVMVAALATDDGSFKRWSLRQVPEVEGGFR